MPKILHLLHEMRYFIADDRMFNRYIQRWFNWPLFHEKLGKPVAEYQLKPFWFLLRWWMGTWNTPVKSSQTT